MRVPAQRACCLRSSGSASSSGVRPSVVAARTQPARLCLGAAAPHGRARGARSATGHRSACECSRAARIAQHRMAKGV
jgi:hypothetical protein